MSVHSEAAEAMLKLEMQLTEYILKLTGKGAVNLAALLLAVLRGEKQIAGKTNVRNMLREGKAMMNFPLQKDLLAQFNNFAKQNGVAYSIVRDPKQPEQLDIIIKQEDAQRVNTILEHIDPQKKILMSEPVSKPESEHESPAYDSASPKTPNTVPQPPTSEKSRTPQMETMETKDKGKDGNTTTTTTRNKTTTTATKSSAIPLAQTMTLLLKKLENLQVQFVQDGDTTALRAQLKEVQKDCAAALDGNEHKPSLRAKVQALQQKKEQQISPDLPSKAAPSNTKVQPSL